MKIIATDYDGTLNRNGITKEKLEAIAKWREKGNKFGVISGRMLPSLINIVNKNNIEYDYLIACNGAVICDNNGEIIKQTKCDGTYAIPLLKFLFNLNCPFGTVAMNEEYRVWAPGQSADKDDYTLETMPPIPWFNQISTLLDTEEEAAHVTEMINKEFNGIFNPLLNGNCIDIVPNGVNKAFGIYEILHIFNGKYNDVIAVGDNINDRHMIKEFRSFAMENGVDEIKALADGIVYDITEIIEAEI